MIDRRFLEFLGNTFLNAARGQAQLEEMTDWIRRSFTAADALPEFFRRAYGLDATAEKKDVDVSGETQTAALEDFQEAYAAWLRMMGAVPLADHRRLEAECAELRKTNEEQARTIRYLSGVLSGDEDAQSTTLDILQNLSEKQTEQFGHLVKALGEYLQDRMTETGGGEPDPDSED